MPFYSKMMAMHKPKVRAEKNTGDIFLFFIEFPGRLKAKVMSLGATLMSLEVPDCHGKLQNVVLGYEKPECYSSDTRYLGSTVGRFANRIGQGRFTLDGQTYSLAQNNGTNHLHGGLKGFNSVLWQTEGPKQEGEAISISFRYTSADGEEGYPGTMQLTVTYRFTATEMQIDYEAETDKASPVSLTNHSYFNLSGQPDHAILDHQLYLNARRFLPLDDQQLPTGEIRKVKGTPFDFLEPKTIGQDIDAADEQVNRGLGYDHYFVLDDTSPDALAAEVDHPQSGRRLQLYTDAPGLQLYTGNVLHQGKADAGCENFGYRTGLCLETQQYPDAPNRPEFPSAVLKPGEIFRSQTRYRFLVQ